jgi:molybdenum cofactor biosynthesis enzyme MoaA
MQLALERFVPIRLLAKLTRPRVSLLDAAWQSERGLGFLSINRIGMERFNHRCHRIRVSPRGKLALQFLLNRLLAVA